MIILVGPVGAGKSVQAQKLVERLDMFWISTGEILRQTRDTAIQEKLHRGELLDDNDVQSVLETAISGVPAEQEIVMDGFPRRISQADWLESQLSKWGRELEAVIHIAVPEKETIARMRLRARHDDSEQAINKRNEEYRDNVMPMVEHFRQLGVLKEVDGVGTVEEVTDRIQKALGR